MESVEQPEIPRAIIAACMATAKKLADQDFGTMPDDTQVYRLPMPEHPLRRMQYMMFTLAGVVRERNRPILKRLVNEPHDWCITNYSSDGSEGFKLVVSPGKEYTHVVLEPIFNDIMTGLRSGWLRMPAPIYDTNVRFQKKTALLCENRYKVVSEQAMFKEMFTVSGLNRVIVDPADLYVPIEAIARVQKIVGIRYEE